MCWPSALTPQRSQLVDFEEPISAGVRADDAVREREHYELGTGFELQLAHDVGAVSVDRADGDEEFLADLLIRVAERQQMENVALSFGQRLGGRWAVGFGNFAAHA